MIKKLKEITLYLKNEKNQTRFWTIYLTKDKDKSNIIYYIQILHIGILNIF